MEEITKLTPAEARAVILESILKKRGYVFEKENSGYYFYKKAVKEERSYLCKRMGFKFSDPEAMIAFFGVAVIDSNPICTSEEVSLIGTALQEGYKEANDIRLALQASDNALKTL